MIWKATLLSSLVMAIAFVALGLQRKGSARQRRSTCLFTLIACAMAWAFAFAPPNWLPEIHSVEDARPPSAVQPVSAHAQPPAADSARPQPPASGTILAPTPTSFDWAIVYRLGIGLCLLGWIGSWIYSVRLAFGGRVAAGLPLKSQWRTRLVPFVKVPVCLGWPCRSILLPTDAVDWDAITLDVALRHEESHLRQQDHFWMHLAYLLCSIQWFNPLAWLLARRLRLECEQVADDAVLATGVMPSTYAELILAFTETKPALTQLSTFLPLYRRSDLSHRLESILSSTTKRNTTNRTKTLIVAAVALSAVAVGSGFTFARWKHLDAPVSGSITVVPGPAPYPQYTLLRDVQVLQIGLKDGGRKLVWDANGYLVPANRIIEHTWQEDTHFAKAENEDRFRMARYRHIVFRVRALPSDGTPIFALWSAEKLRKTISPELGEYDVTAEFLGTKDGWHYFCAPHGIFVAAKEIGSLDSKGQKVKLNTSPDSGDAGIDGIGATAVRIRIPLAQPEDEGSIEKLPLFSKWTSVVTSEAEAMNASDEVQDPSKRKHSAVWSLVRFSIPTQVDHKVHFFLKDGAEIPESLVEGEFIDSASVNHIMGVKYYVGVAPGDIGDVRVSTQKTVDVEVGNIPMSPRRAP